MFAQASYHALLLPIYLGVMAMFMAWLTRERDRVGAPSTRVVAHAKPVLILGLTGTGFFLILAVACAFSAEGRKTPSLPFLFVALSLLGAPLISEYRNARHTLISGGLRYGRMYGSGGLIRWKEVTSAQYSEQAKWFRLESKSGIVARISAAAMGLPAFAQAVLENVPPESIDEKSREVFEQTAAGNPPSILIVTPRARPQAK